MRLKYEAQLWLWALLRIIPGNLGCCIRSMLLPATLGKNVKIWDGTDIVRPSKLIIGNNVLINKRCLLHAGGGIKIGNNVLIGPEVIIYTQNHNFASSSLITAQGYSWKEVVIDDNVWIASRVIILPGVKVGTGSVVGAGSVVTKNVEPYSLVTGNPAKKIRCLK